MWLSLPYHKPQKIEWKTAHLSPTGIAGEYPLEVSTVMYDGINEHVDVLFCAKSEMPKSFM
jgi:hypothetical protein